MPSSSDGAGPARTSVAAEPLCAVEAQPRRLLTADDVWSTAESDAASRVAYELSDSCDDGPDWPQACDLFGDVLGEGWPGYRTNGAYYVAALSLLGVSGETVNEQLLLFRTPESDGLKMLVDEARSCGSKAGASVAGAAVHRLPVQAAKSRYVVIDATVAILIEAPADVDATKLIKAAVQRARG
ncbi:hypothetical protein JIG36_17110 [Actinoplanes sp. LDG1-06]|uniref:Uncharacterized protein n=1 Tax=Paractinoplanes ovalisporus TaxID=2810368 RepID=A0ABS2ABT9_9ACTN|nr:hypothetical protein [Actinoplanes ovalisporus]MBM2617275.1 hypothetical protein [Actinoplanes ovalisporus]